MALWNIYYILYLKFANKFCYSTHNLSKETVLRSGLNFKVEIRSGWERRFLIQVFFGRQPDSSLIQRHNSIQGQNGESGPKKFLPEPDPRKVKKSGWSLKDIEVLAARSGLIKQSTQIRNPKHEALNKYKILILKCSKRNYSKKLVCCFGHSDFGN